MKNFFSALFFLFHFFSQAQITFEKGYFISNNDEKTECFIKNIDWKDNPSQFEYKLNLEESNSKIATITTIKEFGIDNYSKFKRYDVKIEKSSDVIGSISNSKIPVWKNETLFLKVLIEGEATLFSYTSENLYKYFFETKNSPIEQLVRIKYLYSEEVNGKTFANDSYEEYNLFRQQLLNSLKCEAISSNDIENTKYEKSSLVKLFKKYNSCGGQSAITNYTEKNNKDLFAIRITTGIDNANLKFSDPNKYNNLSVDIKNFIVYKFGAELEYTLPFNKNTWSLFLHPTYFKFEQEKDYTNDLGLANPKDADHHVVVNHSSFEIPFGIRHHYFLNKNSKLFFNAAYTLNFIGGTSTFKFDNEKLMNSDSRNNLMLGIGYNYKGKYSIEIRTNFDRQLLNEYTSYSAKYSSTGITLGYRVF